MDELAQGIAALKAGQRDEARQFLARAIRQEPNNERAWLWMYNAANNDQERKHCLQQALRINPKNEKAAQLLKQQPGGSINQAPEKPKSVQKTINPNQQKNILITIGTVLFICIACWWVITVSLSGDGKKDYKTAAFIQCQPHVENRLKAPSSAVFPASSTVNIQEMENNIFEIKSYVDAQNSFGAMIRTYFYCKIQYLGDAKSDEYDSRNWNLLQLDILE